MGKASISGGAGGGGAGGSARGPPTGLSPEAAAATLKAHPFSGTWELTASFDQCDVG